MNIISNLQDWQATRKKLVDKTVGFVPTMGNLHAGHMSLCTRAKRENEITIVSIFVNPTQFNQQQDFISYPRTLEKDMALLGSLNIDYVFVPDAAALYPDDYEIQVSEKKISTELEGAARPGHFCGMLTVVLKLLNLTRPDHAYFGEKDYQQWLLIQKMASALFLSTKIIACPTIREKDGLAFSSRNTRLTAEQRKKAAHFPAILQSSLSLKAMEEKLISLGFRVDYIAEKWGRRLGAVWLDDVRLIDNISIEEDPCTLPYLNQK